MKSKEVRELLDNVKYHYQTFVMNDKIFETWYEVCKDYDFEEVMEKLVDHITGEDYKEIPKVYQLVKHLNTTEEKTIKAKAEIQVCCNLCKKWMDVKEYERHYGRCLDIEYLIGQSEKVGKSMSRIELSKLPQTQIQALYEKYKPNLKELKGIKSL